MSVAFMVLHGSELLCCSYAVPMPYAKNPGGRPIAPSDDSIFPGARGGSGLAVHGVTNRIRGDYPLVIKPGLGNPLYMTTRTGNFQVLHLIV